MADAPPFKRGDIVVYSHKEAPKEAHGALAIVDCVRSEPYGIDVHWITLTTYIRDNGIPSTNWHVSSFEKVGHLDDF